MLVVLHLVCSFKILGRFTNLGVINKTIIKRLKFWVIL